MVDSTGGKTPKAIADALLAEFRQRIDSGEDIDREAFLQEHPEHADSLRMLLKTRIVVANSAESPQAATPSPDQMAQTATFVPTPADLVPDINDQETWNPGDTGGPANESTGPSPDISDGAAACPINFGEYELIEEIARGGMGIVYKARQVKLDRIVAIKMILSGEFASHSDVARFYVEAKAAAALRHPNIVPVYDVGEQDGQHYLSMGYVDGESLAGRIAKGQVTPREAANLVQKMATAIAAAHEKGVIHRDLKPANVLLEKDGNPCITDFGLAKHINDDSHLTSTGLIFGTPSYMSPEQAAGKNEEVGPPSDIYSLGAVLYCLLTGRPPFRAETKALTIVDVINRKPASPRKLNPTIPPELAAICMKCLSKPIDERYATALDLADALSNWNLSPTSQRKIAWKRIPAIINWRAGALLMAGLSLVIVLSSYFFRGDKPQERPVQLIPAPAVPSVNWMPLLRERPTIVAWRSGGQDPPVFDAQRERYSVQSPASTWIARAGDIAPEPFEMRCAISLEGWKGDVGLFWGLHEDPESFPKKRLVCFAVMFTRADDISRATLVAREIVMTPSGTGVDQFKITDGRTIDEQEVTIPTSSEVALTVIVEKSFIRVRIGEQPDSENGGWRPVDRLQKEPKWLSAIQNGVGIVGRGTNTVARELSIRMRNQVIP